MALASFLLVLSIREHTGSASLKGDISHPYANTWSTHALAIVDLCVTLSPENLLKTLKIPSVALFALA